MHSEIAERHALWRLRHMAPHLATEWQRVVVSQHNLLLEGPADATALAITLLELDLPRPIVWRRPGGPLELRCGVRFTLILEDAPGLDGRQQAQLREWIEQVQPPARIVSTASTPLFSWVRRGHFDEVLYYRLNVMLLRLGIGHAN